MGVMSYELRGPVVMKSFTKESQNLEMLRPKLQTKLNEIENREI